MRLIQFLQENRLTVGCVESDSQVRVVEGEGGVYALAQRAISESRPLTEVIEAALSETRVDYAELVEHRRLLPPLTHVDPAHCLVTGTGLTHLGSADTRSAMHAAQKVDESELTDSMRMFRMGLEAGKPAHGKVGPQPEWFYKGDGDCVVPPEADIPSPAFAQDAGEEPELAGLYVIGEDGTPWRVGYAIGNEFSDHVTERFNYLWLAHSKLRACSFGPELLIGELPESLEGTSRIVRDGRVLWEKPFATGEANMAHSLANLEHHHFKYDNFRRAGDVHVHFFGTATLSFADNVVVEPGDRYEIQLDAFGRTLRNTLTLADDRGYSAATAL
ncbi:AraD1 family protein [Salinicola aestuarinus]|uniref:AraD1 family protein n=1 Tax=Salinicola aestuarinus TaxID=1949082 RepID=UPI000DA264D6|nr:AraD1 family protein [Salinicola aestuarinus]